MPKLCIVWRMVLPHFRYFFVDGNSNRIITHSSLIHIFPSMHILCVCTFFHSCIACMSCVCVFVPKQFICIFFDTNPQDYNVKTVFTWMCIQKTKKKYSLVLPFFAAYFILDKKCMHLLKFIIDEWCLNTS